MRRRRHVYPLIEITNLKDGSKFKAKFLCFSTTGKSLRIADEKGKITYARIKNIKYKTL
jgi:hypothetical protein